MLSIAAAVATLVYSSVIVNRLLKFDLHSTTVGRDVIIIVYATVCVAVALAALAAALNSSAVLSRLAMATALLAVLCWSVVHLGGFVISYEAMMRALAPGVRALATGTAA